MVILCGRGTLSKGWIECQASSVKHERERPAPSRPTPAAVYILVVKVLDYVLADHISDKGLLQYYELVLAINSTKVFGMHHKCYAITPIIHDVSGASHLLFIVLFLSKS